MKLHLNSGLYGAALILAFATPALADPYDRDDHDRYEWKHERQWEKHEEKREDKRWHKEVKRDYRHYEDCRIAYGRFVECRNAPWARSYVSRPAVMHRRIVRTFPAAIPMLPSGPEYGVRYIDNRGAYCSEYQTFGLVNGALQTFYGNTCYRRGGWVFND